MNYLFVLFLSVFAFQAYAMNPLCKKANILRLLANGKDICELNQAETPDKAQEFLSQIGEANTRIIKSLNLSQDNPFLEGLTIVLKVTDQSVIESVYELEDGVPTVRLGTTASNFYGNFSKFIYTHEMGHWYISHYLKKVEGKDGLTNISTFQEFFADALALDIYGDFINSDIDAPKCITQIRRYGPDITFHQGVGEFDFASYFRIADACCADLIATGKETELSKSVCRDNKMIEVFWFPKGLPTYSKAPLKYNVHSFGLNIKSNESRLEPHRTSAPMNSFLLELSRMTKKSVMELVLPALKKVMEGHVAYQCSYEDLLKQGVDLKAGIRISRLEELFPTIRKQLKTPEEVSIFDDLFKKYSMKTAQVVFRNELVDIAKYSIQSTLKDQLSKAWREGNPFLTQWSCLNQKTGSFSSDCSFDVACEPEEQDEVPRREFLRRDKNKSIYTPIVKFVNEKTHKEVIFVGLNHTGPRHYFENVEKYLKSELDAEENLTLREFFTCTDKPVLNSNVTNITLDEANILDRYLTDRYYPDIFSKLDRAALAPLIQAYQMKEDSCVVDIDGKTLRPRILVERNQAACDKAHASSLECQWETVERLLSSSANTAESDLILSEEPLGIQVAAINMYKGLPSGGNFDLWGRLLMPAMYVLDGYREASILKNTLMALETKKRVILPWGVGHVQAVKELLYKNGFKQSEVSEIPFAYMSDYGADESIDSMMTVDFPHVGEEYNF